ncbi:MAG TPA: flagellar hook-basal body complex protein FliE [Phycisphaerae bacterium]|nr:flagellar hook-basal body complex protein FliE [Phycisphaerae bacterium]
MAGISPTSPIGPGMPLSGVLGPAQRAAPAAKADFGKMLKAYLGEVDTKQHTSDAAIRDLISGKTQDVVPVVNAVAQADLSFKMLLSVRNKVIEAYKQTMNMQV